jgi:hypothetical protein
MKPYVRAATYWMIAAVVAIDSGCSPNEDHELFLKPDPVVCPLSEEPASMYQKREFIRTCPVETAQCGRWSMLKLSLSCLYFPFEDLLVMEGPEQPFRKVMELPCPP